MSQQLIAKSVSIKDAGGTWGSVNQKKFMAEMGIHFPELKDIDKPVV
jgi:hypothetical protein